MRIKQFIEECVKDSDNLGITNPHAYIRGLYESLDRHVDSLMNYCPYFCTSDPEKCTMLPVYCSIWKTGMNLKIKEK